MQENVTLLHFVLWKEINFHFLEQELPVLVLNTMSPIFNEKNHFRKQILSRKLDFISARKAKFVPHNFLIQILAKCFLDLCKSDKNKTRLSQGNIVVLREIWIESVIMVFNLLVLPRKIIYSDITWKKYCSNWIVIRRFLNYTCSRVLILFFQVYEKGVIYFKVLENWTCKDYRKSRFSTGGKRKY